MTHFSNGCSLPQRENQSVLRILALQEIHFSEKCHHFVTLRDVVSEQSLGLDKREAMLFKVSPHSFLCSWQP